MPVDANGTSVRQADAIAAWSVTARDALLTTARRYHAVITYKELAAMVQEASGITTTQRMDYWIGGLLENVAVEAARRDEPPLTALCVHQNGTIGPGYARAPRAARYASADEPPDVDQLAAVHRLLCYRAYAEDLPADGGSAALTPQVEARKARQRKADARAVVKPVCPTHFLELSATGVCSMCE